MIPVVILTSGANRHKFFANSLCEELDVRGIIVEEKRPRVEGATKEEDEIIIKHFKMRDDAEERHFGAHKNFVLPQEKVLRVENGKSNDQSVFEWIKKLDPKYVILFGTSIIKDPILTFFENHVVNIHLGLSPYYRGSGTNFWPLVDGVPECVGATIHLAVLKVDAGPMLCQVRPNIKETDDSHDIGCDVVVKGAKAMAETIKKYDVDHTNPVIQNLTGGKLFKRKDFNSQAVIKMWDNFKNGMIRDYLAQKEERDAKYPIVTL